MAILKIFKPCLLPNRKSDWAQTWWEALGWQGDLELCPPTIHIVFSADPVGGSVGVGVASRPHSISLLNGHILVKLTQIYHWEGEKCWLDFGVLDPIFRVTGGLRLLEKSLSTPYLLKEWIDFNQTRTSILLGHVKELIRFWWPWPHFQGHRRA